jgi:hypothetical protein
MSHSQHIYDNFSQVAEPADKYSKVYSRENTDGETLAYHNKSGTEFVGLRSRSPGRYQVVYDAVGGTRLLFDIKNPEANFEAIDDALREGVTARKVLVGVLNALKTRHIDFDTSP